LPEFTQRVKVLDKHDAVRYLVGMPGRTAPSPPRLVKRYENRKLYDAAEKRYVTLDGLAGLISRGEDVRVVDQASGEDVTALTLAQVILDGLKQRTARIPREVLARLVRLATRPGTAWGDWVGPREAAARARQEAERIAGRLLARGRLTLEEALALRREIGEAVHGIVNDAQAGLETRIRSLLAPSEAGVGGSLHALKDRLGTLEAYLENPPKPARRAGARRRAR
jgi:polyhydroxyalkanoate synthesis repressor PhaR